MNLINENIEILPVAKPFLRWAGGKRWLVRSLKNFLPDNFNNYHEPFLGGGSVFIHLKSISKIQKKSYLSDQNKELINSFRIIKKGPKSLIEILKRYKNEKDFYYSIREQKYSNKTQQAAQFIFLNRTSFNGIYRVNLKGEYNVPYGFKKYNQLFDFDNIIELHNLFKNTFFKACDFEDTLCRIKENDLVFLDPPYTVAHKNNGFIKYNQKIFAWEDQIRLNNYIEEIKSKNAYFILTNAAHENINRLFNKTNKKHELNRFSVVGGKGAKRQEISEYIFTNYL